MEDDIWKYIVNLTPPKKYTDKLNPETLKFLATEIRTKPELSSALLGFLKNRAAHKSSQVRFLTLLITHYIFMRSMHFRQALVYSQMTDFLDLFYQDPSNSSFAERTRNGLCNCIEIWCDRFKHIYPSLNILITRYPKINPHDQKFELQKLASLENTFINIKMRYKQVFTEIKTLVDLMEVPDEKSDEYDTIIRQNIKSYKNLFKKALEDISRFQIHIKNYAKESELEKLVDKLYEDYSELHLKAQLYGIDEDEFEEVDEEAEQDSESSFE